MANTKQPQEISFEKELKKIFNAIEERNQYSSFKPVTLEEAKVQIDELKKINKSFSDSGKAFRELYSSTEEKKKIEEQKKARQDLLNQGNLKAFYTMHWEGLKKAVTGIGGVDVGKGLAKLGTSFGLFGKFDTSGLIRKFDEYKAFATDRTEKVKNTQLLEQIRKWFLEDNKKQEDVERFLSSIGISTSKTADLFVEFNRQYKEQYEAIRNLGVLNDTGTKEIVKEMSKVRVAIQDEKQSALSNKEYTKFTQEGGTQEEWDIKEKEIAEKEKFEEINKKRNIGGLAPFAHSESAFQWEAQQIPKPSKKKNTSNIPDIDVDTTAIEKGSYSEDNLNELVRQGKVLDEMLVYSREQVILKSEEMRLTEEFRNREGEKKDEKKGPIDSFIDSFKQKFMGGIFDGIGKKIVDSFSGIMSKAGSLMGAAAAPLLVVAIGAVLTKFAWDWSSANAGKDAEEKSKQETGESARNIRAAQVKAYQIDTKDKTNEQIDAEVEKKKQSGFKMSANANAQFKKELAMANKPGINGYADPSRGWVSAEEARKEEMEAEIAQQERLRNTPKIEAKPEKVSIPEEIKKYTTYSNPAQKRAMEDRARQVKEQRDSSIGTQNNTTVNNVKGDEKTFMRDIFSGDGLGATP